MTDSGEIEAIVRDFVAESREGLQQFELTLLELESSLEPAPLLSALFRTIHSIKGSCGFLDLPLLESITHAGETLLARAREGELRIGRDDPAQDLAAARAVKKRVGAQINVMSDFNQSLSVNQAILRGRMLDALRAGDPGLANTLVVVTADHGEELGEDGRTDHTDSLADAVQHVPWIMAGGGIIAGQVARRHTEHVDVLPTLLSHLGVALPDGVRTDGRPQLDGELARLDQVLPVLVQYVCHVRPRALIPSCGRCRPRALVQEQSRAIPPTLCGACAAGNRCGGSGCGPRWS